MNHVTLKTSDGIDIAGIYRALDTPRDAAILLHMMPATKESWDVFSMELSKAGYASIAIDARGHGESTMNGTLDYHRFDELQQQAKIHDVEATFEYLKQKGFSDEHIVVIGASIGANLAIQFLAAHPSVRAAIALSPGLDYHGVKTGDAITHLSRTQRVVIVASDEDAESATDSRTLNERNPSQTTLMEKHGIGHATRMFDKDPELMSELIGLLSSI